MGEQRPKIMSTCCLNGRKIKVITGTRRSIFWWLSSSRRIADNAVEVKAYDQLEMMDGAGSDQIIRGQHTHTLCSRLSQSLPPHRILRHRRRTEPQRCTPFSVWDLPACCTQPWPCSKHRLCSHYSAAAAVAGGRRRLTE
ncbi:hypothetical protein niasHT_025937 [Heterodera trifolii]|uniref:Uncharacterized protein n=1 Tax=Heterodera trifolii TaxID=157864 RepID=A0ABD2JUY7_9BILA